MCKSKKNADVIEPKTKKRISRTPSKSVRSSSDSYEPHRSTFNDPSTSTNNNNLTNSNYNNTSDGGSSSYKNSLKSSASSKASLSSLREALPENAHIIYDFSEIYSATNNFLSKKFSSSSSSSSWRCSIRGKDVIVFQRKLRRPTALSELREMLSLICRSHHSSLVKLHGASISGNYLYLLYDYVDGANLAECLRNPRNPNFTILSNWMSRIQIATDLAHGLDYIHNCTGLNLNFIHNHIKSSSIIVTESSLNAKICHFGTAQLCGEVMAAEECDHPATETKNYKRKNSRLMKFEGTRGYMAPEFQSNGIATQKSDVYAFGVVILELISGEEPLKYTIDGDNGGYGRLSVTDSAKEAVEGGGVRRWIDKRLKDSYPVEVAEKLARLGVDCTVDDPDNRPEMGWVTGRVSKMFLESKNWAEKIGFPTDFSVSLAPR